MPNGLALELYGPLVKTITKYLDRDNVPCRLE